MNRISQTTSPETTRAVVALGKASAEARRHSSALSSRERGMAERLARTPGAPETLIGLVSEAAAAIGARELDLSSVWPISASSRPSGNAATVAACERALAILADSRLRSAAAIAELDPENAESLLAEATHALDLRERLDGLGCDWRAAEPTSPIDIAVAAIDAFHKAGADDARGATAVRDVLAQRQSLLDSVSATVADLLAKAGTERATVTQVRNVCRALAAMPTPFSQSLLDTATLRDAKDGLDAAIARRSSLEETVSRIEARIGPAWKQEKPSKLQSAADILAAPGDSRRAGVARYAKGLGVDPESPQAGRQLRLMAESLEQLAAPPAKPGLLALFPPLGGGAGSLPELAAYAERALAWRAAVDTSESISHALGNLLASGRFPSPEIARFIAETIAPFLEKESKVPFKDLVASNRESLDHVQAALDAVAPLSDDLVAQGRSAQRLMRELRLSVARMETDPARPIELDVDTLCEGASWQRIASESLPASLDPRDEALLASFRDSATAAIEHALLAERKVQAIGKLVGADAQGWDLPDLTKMTRVHGTALALASLELARRLVAEADGFHIVAALEEDSVPGERWEEYLVHTAGSVVPAPPPVQAVAAPPQPESRPAFDFTEPTAWSAAPLPGRRRDA